VPTIIVRREIRAPADLVFRAVSDLEHLPETAAHIVKVEFLSERRAGVGTRFRETRVMGGRTHVTDLEVTECAPERRMIRMVADTDGTVWDTRISVAMDGDGCELAYVMEARGSTWSKRVLNWLLQGLYRKGMSHHADTVKAHCEDTSRRGGDPR
jgi:uncharacterized protein YndB with AHSA1/START domain